MMEITKEKVFVLCGVILTLGVLIIFILNFTS